MKRETRDFHLGVTYQLKEKLKSHSREDKQQKLEMCWKLLLTLHSSGCQDFSKASFGKALENAGIMKHQSFKNTTGKDYQELLLSFTEEAAISNEKPTNKDGKDYLNQIVDQIGNLDDQARLREALAELVFLRKENTALRNEMSRMQRVSFYGSVNSKTAPNSAVSINEPQSSTISLQRFLEEDWMSIHGLTICNDGSIACDGQEITLPGFAQQLRNKIYQDPLSSHGANALLHFGTDRADLPSVTYENNDA